MIGAFDASLALVAERLGDPTLQVYEALFARLPEMRALFLRDADGAIRGHMLQEALEAARDLLGARAYGGHFIASEWVNHQNLGVPSDAYVIFYDVAHDVFRAAGADEWTDAMDAAWRAVRADVRAIVAARAAA